MNKYGGVEVLLQVFLISTLDGDELSASSSDYVQYPLKRIGWVDTREAWTWWRKD
jgi:uncharacterized HAD superfamily protein